MVAEPVPFNPSIGVHVSAADPLTKAGIVSQLRSAQGFIVSSGDTPHIDGVALVVADDVTDAITTEIRSLRARGVSRVVLLVTWVNDKGLLVLEQRSHGDPATHIISSLPPIAGLPRSSTSCRVRAAANACSARASRPSATAMR